MLGFDLESYQIYYQKIIVPVINEYCAKDYGIEVKPDAEELIWINYVKFNRHCREEYMWNPEKLADRHKIASCYIYAILKADVLACSLSKQFKDEKNLLLQLYYTKKEGNYNILALADSLYLIENYNLVMNGLQEDIFKKPQGK